ncbi:unnamed protein product [Lathyrus sativus]|nr:unnamed protein product [Lathyrus sativus]
MYDPLYLGRCRLKPYFVEVKGFIAFAFAFAQECCRREGGVRCLCLKYRYRCIISYLEEVENRLKRKSFRKDYWIWTSNEEKLLSNVPETRNTQQGSTSRSHMKYEGQFNLINDMVVDVLGGKCDI